MQGGVRAHASKFPKTQDHTFAPGLHFAHREPRSLIELFSHDVFVLQSCYSSLWNYAGGTVTPPREAYDHHGHHRMMWAQISSYHAGLCKPACTVGCFTLLCLHRHSLNLVCWRLIKTTFEIEDSLIDSKQLILHYRITCLIIGRQWATGTSVTIQQQGNHTSSIIAMPAHAPVWNWPKNWLHMTIWPVYHNLQPWEKVWGQETCISLSATCVAEADLSFICGRHQSGQWGFAPAWPLSRFQPLAHICIVCMYVHTKVSEAEECRFDWPWECLSPYAWYLQKSILIHIGVTWYIDDYAALLHPGCRQSVFSTSV